MASAGAVPAVVLGGLALGGLAMYARLRGVRGDHEAAHAVALAGVSALLSVAGLFTIGGAVGV